MARPTGCLPTSHSCEANLGIIAANLALSRMFYLFVRQRGRKPNSTQGTRGYQLRSHFSHKQTATAINKGTHRAFHPLGSGETDATCIDYQMAGDGTITKTTDFDLREEPSRAVVRGHEDLLGDRDVEDCM